VNAKVGCSKTPSIVHKCRSFENLAKFYLAFSKAPIADFASTSAWPTAQYVLLSLVSTPFETISFVAAALCFLIEIESAALFTSLFLWPAASILAFSAFAALNAPPMLKDKERHFRPSWRAENSWTNDSTTAALTSSGLCATALVGVNASAIRTAMDKMLERLKWVSISIVKYSIYNILPFDWLQRLGKIIVITQAIPAELSSAIEIIGGKFSDWPINNVSVVKRLKLKNSQFPTGYHRCNCINHNSRNTQVYDRRT
ncbi:MAG: hypothetical protein ACI8YI_002287, partial [Paracoccaceae bacterium]